MITPERLQEIKDKWEVPREHTPFSSFERGLLETLDELIAALEAAQAELEQANTIIDYIYDNLYEELEEVAGEYHEIKDTFDDFDKRVKARRIAK